MADNFGRVGGDESHVAAADSSVWRNTTNFFDQHIVSKSRMHLQRMCTNFTLKMEEQKTIKMYLQKIRTGQKSQDIVLKRFHQFNRFFFLRQKADND